MGRPVIRPALRRSFGSLLHFAAVDRFDCKLNRILGRAADG
jgi:hypothetical protein